MALDYQGGYQPNMHFTVVENEVRDATGGIGVMIDGNPDNMSLSHGHVVRFNKVSGHIAPPQRFTNFDGAITVGIDIADSSCGCRSQKLIGCCFGSVQNAVSDVVVESNQVVVNKDNGTCHKNGVRMFAARSVERNNTCVEV